MTPSIRTETATLGESAGAKPTNHAKFNFILWFLHCPVPVFPATNIPSIWQRLAVPSLVARIIPSTIAWRFWGVVSFAEVLAMLSLLRVREGVNDFEFVASLAIKQAI